MKIEVLGTRCQRCDQLYANALTAAADFDHSLEIEVQKIGDVNYFMTKGVFMTPGLVIAGKVISVGKVLAVEEIKAKIQEQL
ncbi:MAG: thioredoxin family protein [Desulfobacterales bacterium]|nr:MAG: thioredoxin family protein [Desulfobacterales bacterium]